MKIQNNLGADIIMAFDVCVPFPSEYNDARRGRVPHRALVAALQGHASGTRLSLCLGSSQGSTFPDLRAMSAHLTAPSICQATPSAA